MGEFFLKSITPLALALFMALPLNRAEAIVISPEQYENIVKIQTESLFPVPPRLEKRVDFWIDIFTIYRSSQIILHDAENPERIYLIFDSPEPPDNLFAPYTQIEQDQIDEKKEIVVAFLHAIADARFGAKTDTDELSDEAAQAYSDIAGLFWGLFDGSVDLDDLDDFQSNILRIAEYFKDERSRDALIKAAGEKRIRAQRGASDNFREALVYSGLYIDMVRDMLVSNGIPPQIACLPFIESFYNPTAMSHKNAAGIWQFTRWAARDERLRIGPVIDERKDPYLSTLAAANKLKKENRLFVKTARSLGINIDNVPLWDLNITAWNLGPYGLRKAIKRMKSVEIDKILFDYRQRSKGFAVKNFYSEFLAAMHVYANSKRYFKNVKPYPPIDTLVEDYELPSSISFSGLAQDLGIEKEQLHLFNPSLTLAARLDAVKIPRSTVIKVPKGTEVQRSLEQIYAQEKFLLEDEDLEEQLTYTVRRGDTLSEIAYKFGVGLSRLMNSNGLRSSRIYPSTVLIIPLK